jgi:copper(I)-binding protein
LRLSAALAAILLASCTAKAPAPEIHVQDAWARATVPGQQSAAAYLTIRNSGGQDRLIGASTDIGAASLHSTSMDNGVMRMRPLADLAIPGGSAVELKPGGTHVMIMGVKQLLAAGSSFPLDLKFAKSGDIHVTVAVKDAGATM